MPKHVAKKYKSNKNPTFEWFLMPAQKCIEELFKMFFIYLLLTFAMIKIKTKKYFA